MPFVFVTETQYMLFNVGSGMSYIFLDTFSLSSHQQSTCDSLLVLFNVILYIETVLTIRKSSFEVTHFV
jgi:hypothetical protein